MSCVTVLSCDVTLRAPAVVHQQQHQWYRTAWLTAHRHAIRMATPDIGVGSEHLSNGLSHWQLLERGVRTATALLAACDAESRWGAAAGAAVDEAAVAANRERVMSFAAVAASAAAMLLQRLQVAPVVSSAHAQPQDSLGIKTVQNNVAAGSTKHAIFSASPASGGHHVTSWSPATHWEMLPCSVLSPHARVCILCFRWHFSRAYPALSSAPPMLQWSLAARQVNEVNIFVLGGGSGGDIAWHAEGAAGTARGVGGGAGVPCSGHGSHPRT